jgi:hypothetical protein
MTADAHASREAIARADAQAALVDLLVGYVDRAYVTSGQPGVLTAVREMFRRMDPAALTGLVYQLGLEVEPAREAEAGVRPPEPEQP